jgi:autotransporter-associated beta strand protein
LVAQDTSGLFELKRENSEEEKSQMIATRREVGTIAVIAAVAFTASQSLAATYRWINDGDGAANGNWGNANEWSPNTGFPNAATDDISQDSTFTGGETAFLATAAGVDSSFTVGSISMSASTSGNRSLTFSNVLNGTGVIIFDDDDGTANVTVFANNNRFTFNSGVQLIDPLLIASTSTSGTNTSDTKATFNGSISESGGSKAVTVNLATARIVVFNGSNSYSGGTTLEGGGTLRVAASGTLGSGDVTVTAGVLQIQNTSNILNDAADISIANGGLLELSSGINDVVGSLTLGGVVQPAGIYNSSTHPSFLSGTGSLQVVPEPALAAVFAVAAPLLLTRGRRRNA